MNKIMNYIEDYSWIIVWMPLAIFLLVFILSILFGLIRGGRKNFILMILSVISLVISLLICFLVLKSSAFEQMIVNLLGSITSNSFNAKSISGAVVELLTNDITNDKVSTITNIFGPYLEVLVNSIVGLVYMIVTFIMWGILKLLLYLIVYIPFLREGKYRKKINKAYKESEELYDGVEDTNRPKIERYRKRRLLGALVGSLRGIFIGILSISIIGTLFYITTGGYDPNLTSRDKVIVNVGEEKWNITPVYNMIDDYKDVNVLVEGVKIDGVPLYANISGLFASSKIVIEKDNVNQKINPIKEIGQITKLMHETVGLIDKYEININSKDILNQLNTLINENTTFKDDVLKYINSIGNSAFQKSLGRTLTANLVDILDGFDINNYYIDTIFKGEHAISISDLGNREDISIFLNIICKAIEIGNKYSKTEDFKELLINDSQDIIDITDEILKLSIFKSNKADNINYIISELLEKPLSNVSLLKDISLDGVKWVDNGSAKGEIETFINCIEKFLDLKIIVYDGEIKIDLNNIHSIFEETDETTSISHDIANSFALRCVMTTLINHLNSDQTKFCLVDSVYDENGILKQSEVEKLFEAVDVIVRVSNLGYERPILFNEITSLILPDMINSLVKNNSLVIQEILDSNIIMSVASKYIYDYIEKSYPNILATELILDEKNINNNIKNWVGTDGELYILLKTCCELYEEGVISYENEKFSYDVKKFAQIANDGSYLVSRGSYSKILKSVLVELIPEYVTGIDIIYPEESFAVEGGNKFLSTDETKNLIKTLGFVIAKLEIDDSIDANTLATKFLDLVKDKKNVESLTGSLVFEATISKLLYDNLKDSEYMSNLDSSLVLDDVNFDINIKNWYGVDGEYRKTLYSLNEAFNSGLISIDTNNDYTISYDINCIGELFSGKDKEGIDVILDSKLTLSIISGVIVKLDIGYPIYLPDKVYDGDNISKSEIRSLFEVCNILNKYGIDFESETISEDIKDVINDICKNEEDKNKILKSTIMSGTISYAIHENLEKLTGDIVVNIPSDLKLNDINDSNMSNWVGDKKELYYLLNGLKYVDLVNSTDVNFIFKLSDTEIGVINSSKVISSTITSSLKSLELDDMQVVLVDEACDESGNIKTSELCNTIKAIKIISDYDSMSETEKENFSFETMNIEINDVLSNETKKDAIFSSYIIQSTVSFKVYNLINGKVSVPKSLVLDNKESSNINNWINKDSTQGELNNLMDSLDMLGLDDNVADSSFDIDEQAIINDLILNKTDDVIKSNVLNLINSKIVHRVLTDSILDAESEPNSLVVVPSSVIEKEDIKNDELVNLFIGINLCGVDDINNIDSKGIIDKLVLSVDNTKVEENILKLTESAILHATVSEIINSNESINVPAIVKDNENKIIKNELVNLFIGIKLLGLDDVKSVDENFVLNLEITSLDTILNSIIILYMVSDNIIELSNEEGAEFKIPSIAKEKDSNNKSYVKKTEIINLFKAIKEFEITHFDNLEINDLLTKDMNLDVVLNSDIIRYTISDNFINSGITPSTLSYEDKNVKEKFITKDEIKNTFDSLKLLEITQFDNIEVSSEKFLSLTDEEIDTLLSSWIIYREISNQIASTVEVPSYVISNPSDVILDEGENYIDKVEIHALDASLNVLGIESLDKDNFNVTNKLFDVDMDTCLNSMIIWHEISKKINGTSGVIVVTEAYDSIYKECILKDEIKSFVSATKSLGVNELKYIEISPTSINDKQIDSMANSIIYRSTVSKKLLYDNKVRTILDSTDQYHYEENTFYSMKVDEFKALFNGLKKLNISDIEGGINFTFEDLVNLANNDLETVLTSDTLWVYISDLIFNKGIQSSFTLEMKSIIKFNGTNIEISNISGNIVTRDSIKNYF